MQSQKGTLNKEYGYGIVDRNGHPWWGDACVCQDRDPMEEQVNNLNDETYLTEDDRRPYRVVALRFD